MPDLPKYEKVLTVRHEFTIGRSDRDTDAKTFEFGLMHVKRELESLGLESEMDDAYFVRAGDGGEIVIYVDEEQD